MAVSRYLPLLTQKALSLFQHAWFKLLYPKVKIVRWQSGYYSQAGQDILLSRLFFHTATNTDDRLVFLDVGANDPIIFSNSYYFEKYYGTLTLAIDPLPTKKRLWAYHRPLALFEQCLIGTTSSQQTLFIPSPNSSDEDPLLHDDMFATTTPINGKLTQSTLSIKELQVSAYPLKSILKKYAITDILIASIDVEGAELDVLHSIDFDSVTIRCLVVENNHTSVLGDRAIRDFLISRGYQFRYRIWGLDDVYILP